MFFWKLVMKPLIKISSEGDLTLNRRKMILEMLEDKGKVRNNDLARIFNVSTVTIRNDLEKLEEKGLLIRTRGGCLKAERVRIDYQLNIESSQHLKEKRAIGKKAAELVMENDTIIIDSGTTTLELARNLSRYQNITIITNALNIASQFINNSNITVIMPGGNLRYSSFSLIGPIAEEGIKNLYCDKIFIGVNGIDSRYGISTTHLEDASLNKIMIESSKEVIVLTDSSKFLKRSFSLISPINKIHTIITDSGIPQDELSRLRNAGINMILV